MSDQMAGNNKPHMLNTYGLILNTEKHTVVLSALSGSFIELDARGAILLADELREAVRDLAGIFARECREDL